MKIRTISAADAAFILRSKLGACRAWSDFLTDCIRDRQSIKGVQLLPCCEQKNGRLFRPRYSLQDIKEFIENVRAVEKDLKPGAVNIIMLDVNPSHAWFVRKFDKDGNPIAMLRRIGTLKTSKFTFH